MEKDSAKQAASLFWQESRPALLVNDSSLGCASAVGDGRGQSARVVPRRCFTSRAGFYMEVEDHCWFWDGNLESM